MTGDELLIRGGLVLAPEGPRAADVRVRRGHVAEVGCDLAPGEARVVDAAGCWVGPGFVDVHTHLREPGQEHKEDIASGSAAAAAGGYTAVVAMPNTTPAMDDPAIVAQVRRRGRQVGLVEVVPSAAISVGRQGATMAPVRELAAAGVRMFTDDGDAVADSGLMRRAMEAVAACGGVVSQHAVDPGLAKGAHVNEGEVATRLGLPGVPAVAEEIVIRRDVALVRLTGVRYHVQHVSTAGAVAVIAAAKEEGLAVTAEVTPHHLTFTDADVGDGDTTYKMMPPLRTAEDVAVLRRALLSGVIDAVATDHAPHSPEEKAVPFAAAPPGVTGLEWAAAAVNTALQPDIATFFMRMAVAPAQIADIADRHGRVVTPGDRANLVVFDPQARFTADRTVSRSRNSPYLGKSWQGVVRLTVFAGAVTHEAVLR